MCNFVAKCNEAARDCSNPAFRDGLKLAAGCLHTAIEDLNSRRSLAAMQDLVATWTIAAKMLAKLPPEGDPAPLGGDTCPTLLRQNVA